MPFADDDDITRPIKALCIGDSGFGKTGALAALAKAGYNLRILDWDNGVDILIGKKGVLKDEPKETKRRINYQTVTDSVRIAGQNIIPTATAWPRGMKILGDWPDNLGKIETWTTNDILVIDSVTFAGKAAVRFVQGLNGRIADLPQIQDFLVAQGLIEKMCSLLYSDTVKCNVLALSHIREVARTRQELDSKGRLITLEEEGTRKGYAETGAGKAFSPLIGRYFNSVFLFDQEGSGAGTRRIIRTVPHDNIGVKNSAPGSVKPSYSIANGLAEIFADIRGGNPTN